MFEFSGYIFLTFCNALFLLTAERDNWLMGISTGVGGAGTVMMLLTLGSWHHINNSSKSLRQHGVKMNRCLMRLYSIWWVCFFVLTGVLIYLFSSTSQSTARQSMTELIDNGYSFNNWLDQQWN